MAGKQINLAGARMLTWLKHGSCEVLAWAVSVIWYAGLIFITAKFLGML